MTLHEIEVNNMKSVMALQESDTQPVIDSRYSDLNNKPLNSFIDVINTKEKKMKMSRRVSQNSTIDDLIQNPIKHSLN